MLLILKEHLGVESIPRRAKTTSRTSTKLLLLILALSSLSYLSVHQEQQASSQTIAGGTNVNNNTGSGALVGAGGAGVPQSKNSNNSSTKNATFLTYENPDFGIKARYPSNWIKLEDNLLFHTIAAFQLIHENIYDFTNTTLAEVDLRIFPAPQNETFAKLNLGQINTRGEVISSYYKNATTTLGGFPALKIVNYFFGDVTQKEMQVWTFIPSKNVLLEMLYIAQPSKYSVYLPVVQKIIDSVEIAH